MEFISGGFPKLPPSEVEGSSLSWGYLCLCGLSPTVSIHVGLPAHTKLPLGVNVRACVVASNNPATSAKIKWGITECGAHRGKLCNLGRFSLMNARNKAAMLSLGLVTHKLTGST